ncbi:helix-turn-helix domain-containing protein, partial [Candidatus Pacearchaeota archaeon]|nr:helix-turn-helix domain-containing protein [Candidatus Pacearchaeota archaeon]
YKYNLTEKQKEAFALAVENGCYGYPRKVKLEKLGKIDVLEECDETRIKNFIKGR